MIPLVRQLRSLSGMVAVCSAGLGCAGALPEATNAHLESARKTEAETTLSDLQRGRSLYAAKCANCHALREPSSVSAEKWPHEVEEMRTEQNVRLSPAETEDILRYLTAVSRVTNR